MITGPILIVKLADIGDAVLALPAIQTLRAQYPEVEIDVLTTPAGALVFELSPAIDRVTTLAKQRFDHVRGLVSPRGLVDLARLTVTLRARRYSAVVILHHLTTTFGARKYRALAAATGAPIVAGLDNGRGDFLTHRATDFGFGPCTEWEYGLAVAETLGASSAPREPEISIPDDAERSAVDLLERNGIGDRYFVVHPEVGDFSPARGWPAERFISVARELSAQFGMTAVFVGTGSGGELDELLGSGGGIVDLRGKTTFAELCAIVRGADLVIGCDSAVAHLAGAFDRRGVTLFGPSNVRAWKPYGATALVPEKKPGSDSPRLALRLDLPCSPCLYTGFRLGRPQGCPLRTCMMDIEPEHVIGAAIRVRENTR